MSQHDSTQVARARAPVRSPSKDELSRFARRLHEESCLRYYAKPLERRADAGARGRVVGGGAAGWYLRDRRDGADRSSFPRDTGLVGLKRRRSHPARRFGESATGSTPSREGRSACVRDTAALADASPLRPDRSRLAADPAAPQRRSRETRGLARATSDPRLLPRLTRRSPCRDEATKRSRALAFEGTHPRPLDRVVSLAFTLRSRPRCIAHMIDRLATIRAWFLKGVDLGSRLAPSTSRAASRSASAERRRGDSSRLRSTGAPPARDAFARAARCLSHRGQ